MRLGIRLKYVKLKYLTAVSFSLSDWFAVCLIIKEGRRVGESFQSCLGPSCNRTRTIWGNLMLKGGRDRERERGREGEREGGREGGREGEREGRRGGGEGERETKKERRKKRKGIEKRRREKAREKGRKGTQKEEVKKQKQQG